MIDTPHTRAHDLAGEIMADDPPQYIREVVIALGALVGVQPPFGYSCPGAPWPVAFVRWRREICAAARAIEAQSIAPGPVAAARWDALRALVTYAGSIDPEVSQ